ncbi:hypothetical protein GQ43DRAFT_427316 [Delitschia confertaspora ATCC 74209]|uniref:Mmc1 C-terminal domain-containing protein n=1 Tax=Delitschia confertaspora ATCC 74209 TaxID=1513339 RepID=A0A9P4JBF7_9PLEO|nr:hypothetical protein GQ43DRAFT_427316 [Delitschia confertaspora ATCC 74209]
MPSWMVSMTRAQLLVKRNHLERLSVTVRSRAYGFPIASRSQRAFRRASTLVSPTAINTPTHIPTPNKELYHTLSELDHAAGPFVNTGRLQLALRGLSTENVAARVAVLSLDDQRSARRLVRLLLADPLAAKEDWESRLEGPNVYEEKAILLRYGDESELHPASSLFESISVPSRTLQTNNLEILISTVNNASAKNNGAPAASTHDPLLVPEVQSLISTPITGTGVPYAVHKTLVIGQGVDSAVAYGRATSEGQHSNSKVVKFTVNLPAPQQETDVNNEAQYPVIDIELASEALEKFRQSPENSLFYEKGWFRSGMPLLSDWLLKGIHEPRTGIPLPVKNLIVSILDEVDAAITRAEPQQLAKTGEQLNLQRTREYLTEQLQLWAEQGHTELRDRLDDAYDAVNWHKLAWWKLFWRVDDVEMVASEILEQHWLTGAEKNSIYLAGHLNQSSVTTATPTPELEQFDHRTLESEMPILRSGLPFFKTNNNSSMSVHPAQQVAQRPWPLQIASIRTELLNETVPTLQALAQRLVASTLSTTGLTSALSALLFISMPTFSIFEAAAVGAVGLVFSLKRMQRVWEDARASWQAQVREEGRRALKDTEEVFNGIINDTSRIEVESTDTIKRKWARELVKRAREELKKIEKS